MKRFLCLIILISVSFSFLFPKDAYADTDNLTVVEKIPAPTVELQVGETLLAPETNLEVVGLIKPVDLGFEVVEKIPASLEFTVTPVLESPISLPTISNPTPLPQYPVLTNPVPVEPVLTDPVPIEQAPVLVNPTPVKLIPSAPEEPKIRKSIEELIALAKDDLAQRLRIKVEEISTQSIVAKEWPDASLGCPREGMLYAQVITPGYLIILEARERVYDYRASLNWVSFCSSSEGAEDHNGDSPGNFKSEIFVSGNNTGEVDYNRDDDNNEIGSVIERQTQNLPNNLSTIIGRLKIVLTKFFSFGTRPFP